MAASTSPEVEMTQADGPREVPRESIFGQARRLIAGVIGLAKLEIAHGRAEIGEMVGRATGGVVMILIAVGLVVLALIAFLVFLILAIAALSGLPGWLVALIVVFLLGIIAVILVWRGIKRIQIGPPEETIASVKEDIAWAKRLLRRG